MKTYIGTKIIQASPVTKGPEGPEGYHVVYQDGYESWSPKDVFEESYREITGVNFGLAVEAMKKGSRVARAGWNGKGVFIEIIFDEGDCMLLSSGEGYEMCSWIGMKTADNKFVPWTASQTDILADDWVVLE